MILYKYTTRNAIRKIVQSASLLVRPINEFNDPFESVPAANDETPFLVADNVLKQSEALRRMANDPELNPQRLTAPQLRLWMDKPENMEKVSRILVRRSGVKPLEFAVTLQNVFSQSFGLVCLTANPSNLLMWSHYAEHHFGYVLAINASLWEPGAVDKVTYSDVRVPFLGREPKEEDAHRLVTTKASDWTYEEEYRILCKAVSWQVVDGRKQEFLALNPRQILWICAGVRTAVEDVESLRVVLHSSAFSDVPVYQALLHPMRFRIDLPVECSEIIRKVPS